MYPRLITKTLSGLLLLVIAVTGIADSAAAYRRVVRLAGTQLTTKNTAQTAQQLYQKGQRKQAKQRWQKLIAADSTALAQRLGAYWGLAELAQTDGQPFEAIGLAKAAVELKPDAPNHYRLAQLYFRQGRTEQTLETLEIVKKLDPYYAATYYSLCMCDYYGLNKDDTTAKRARQLKTNYQKLTLLDSELAAQLLKNLKSEPAA